ncbi:MAG: helix-turn-helix transcriptional regulator [Ruminococcus sp.]|nr:helix-turn-helix transcriptional regulator [Ruminococcus sp.]
MGFRQWTSFNATQLNNYCRNNVSRIDLPVLARICDYLNCDISDILWYVPSEKQAFEKEYSDTDEEICL